MGDRACCQCLSWDMLSQTKTLRLWSNASKPSFPGACCEPSFPGTSLVPAEALLSPQRCGDNGDLYVKLSWSLRMRTCWTCNLIWIDCRVGCAIALSNLGTAFQTQIRNLEIWTEVVFQCFPPIKTSKCCLALPSGLVIDVFIPSFWTKEKHPNTAL